MTRTACGGRFLSFLFGAAAGATAALLLTPRSGRETREYIADRGNEVSEDVARRAQSLAADVQHRAGGWLDRGRDLLEAESRRLRDAFDAGRQAMHDEIRRTQMKIGGSGAPPDCPPPGSREVGPLDCGGTAAARTLPTAAGSVPPEPPRSC